MSMLPESYSNLRPEEQDAIADFDLSMLDTPDFYSKIRTILGPSTADAPKFEPPVQRIHPDSSKIISILDPPPFEVPDNARAIATKRIRNNQSNDQRAKVNELNRIRTSASRMMLSQEERETSNLNDRLRMQSNRAVANRSGDARLQHD
ncbi:hypothetical protein J6590_075011, partial [Homalodisca vitripennis]